MAKLELSDRERYASQYREGEGMAYAWGKTARLLTEPFLMEALQETSGDFLAVDLCCSYPIYRQIATGQHKSRTRTEMRKVSGAFVDELQGAHKRNQFSSVTSLDAPTLKRLRNELTPKDSLTRQLMESALFDVMCLESSKGVDEETLKQRLLNGFRLSTKSYEVKTEPSGHNPGDKGTWQYMVAIEEGTTFKKDLVMIMGERNAEALVNDTAEYFAERLAGNVRGFRVISLDAQDLKSISQEAEKSFPKRYRNTRYFRGGRDGHNYIQADMRHLPFIENSVSFFSSIEGWPFYGSEFDNDDHVRISEQIARELKPGGRAVFFPWCMQGETDRHRESLEAAEDVWRKEGLIIVKSYFDRDQLRGDMSSREYDLVHRSPVFSQGEDKFVSLAVQKPSAA
jgi:hypothetical protein